MSWIKNTVLQKKDNKTSYGYLWERLANNKELSLAEKKDFYSITDYSNHQETITYVRGSASHIGEILKFGDHPNVIKNIWEILKEALVHTKGLEKGIYFPADLITNNTPEQILHEMQEIDKDYLLLSAISCLTKVPKWLDKQIRTFIIDMQLNDNSKYKGFNRAYFVKEYNKYKETRKIIDD